MTQPKRITDPKKAPATAPTTVNPKDPSQDALKRKAEDAGRSMGEMFGFFPQMIQSSIAGYMQNLLESGVLTAGQEEALRNLFGVPAGQNLMDAFRKMAVEVSNAATDNLINKVSSQYKVQIDRASNNLQSISDKLGNVDIMSELNKINETIKNGLNKDASINELTNQLRDVNKNLKSMQDKFPEYISQGVVSAIMSTKPKITSEVSFNG